MALDVRYLRGTSAQYEAYLKANKIVATNFYYIDGKDLYLGKTKLSNQEDIQVAITELKLPETYATKTSLNELSLAVKINAEDIISLQQQLQELAQQQNEELVMKIQALEEKTQELEEKHDTIELKFTAFDSDITEIKTDIITLKTITNGIGGEEEPPTIMAAIDNAKTEMKTYIDEALSWQTME